MLVGKHGYTCGFFSSVSLFISDIQGMTDIQVTIARSVLEEASLKTGNKSILKTLCYNATHIYGTNWRHTIPCT